MYHKFYCLIQYTTNHYKHKKKKESIMQKENM